MIIESIVTSMAPDGAIRQFASQSERNAKSPMPGKLPELRCSANAGAAVAPGPDKGALLASIPGGSSSREPGTVALSTASVSVTGPFCCIVAPVAWRADHELVTSKLPLLAWSRQNRCQPVDAGRPGSISPSPSPLLWLLSPPLSLRL